MAHRHDTCYYFITTTSQRVHTISTANKRMKELTAKDMSLNSPSTTAVPLKRGAGLPINVSLIFVVLIRKKASQFLYQSNNEKKNIDKTPINITAECLQEAEKKN